MTSTDGTFEPDTSFRGIFKDYDERRPAQCPRRVAVTPGSGRPRIGVGGTPYTTGLSTAALRLNWCRFQSAYGWPHSQIVPSGGRGDLLGLPH